MGSKLHAIYPVVGTARHNKLLSRCEVVIINRHLLGHFRLTHSYLSGNNQMSGNNHPVCESSKLPLTVKHILVDCPDVQDTQLKYFTTLYVKDICQQWQHH